MVKSARKDDLVADLTETFANLRCYQIKLNPLKCTFGVPKGQLLGYVISERGIEANLEKILAITRITKPACLLDVQKLAGRVATLSRFIPRLSDKAMPLYRLLKKSDSFEWTSEAQAALKALKTALQNAPVLAAPLPKEPARSHELTKNKRGRGMNTKNTMNARNITRYNSGLLPTARTTVPIESLERKTRG